MGINEYREHMFRDNRLGLDDTFAFGCKRCGDCCRNRLTDILLIPQDIYRMSKYLGKRTGDVVTKYCKTYPGPKSRFPQVMLKPKSYGNVCPFLSRKAGCTIHAAKPGACALYPLGRGYDRQTKEIIFAIADDTCKQSQEVHTVREWIGGFGLLGDEANEEYRIWCEFTHSSIPRFQKLHKQQLSPERMAELYFYFNGILYVMYDTGKDFLPQMKENIRIANEYLSSLKV